MNTENTACARIEEAIGQFDAKGVLTERSEERRVGKECP